MHSWSSGARKSRSGDALGGVQSPLWEQRNDETRLRRSCFCRMALSSRKTHQSCLITADYELGGDVLKRAKHNIRSVDAGEATVADPSTIPTGTQLVIQNIAVETDAIPVANAQHDPPSDHQAFDDSRDSNTSLLRETIRPRQRDPSAAAVQALAE